MKAKPSECYVISGKVIQDRLDELNAIKAKSMARLINLSDQTIEVYKSQEKFLKELQQSKPLNTFLEDAYDNGLQFGNHHQLRPKMFDESISREDYLTKEIEL